MSLCVCMCKKEREKEIEYSTYSQISMCRVRQHDDNGKEEDTGHRLCEDKPGIRMGGWVDTRKEREREKSKEREKRRRVILLN